MIHQRLKSDVFARANASSLTSPSHRPDRQDLSKSSSRSKIAASKFGLTKSKFGFRKPKFDKPKFEPTFRERVLAVVKKIPKGSSMTYKEVATEAGNSQAARAVGAIMRTNFDPGIPCHRVVRSGGSMGGYNRGGGKRKREILVREGAL